MVIATANALIKEGLNNIMIKEEEKEYIPSVFASTIAYIDQEKERHLNDEMTARGKVEELKELRARLLNTCDRCGNHVYPDYKDKYINLENHMKEQHS